MQLSIPPILLIESRLLGHEVRASIEENFELNPERPSIPSEHPSI